MTYSTAQFLIYIPSVLDEGTYSTAQFLNSIAQFLLQVCGLNSTAYVPPAPDEASYSTARRSLLSGHTCPFAGL